MPKRFIRYELKITREGFGEEGFRVIVLQTSSKSGHVGVVLRDTDSAVLQLANGLLADPNLNMPGVDSSQRQTAREVLRIAAESLSEIVVFDALTADGSERLKNWPVGLKFRSVEEQQSEDEQQCPSEPTTQNASSAETNGSAETALTSTANPANGK